MAYQGPTWVDRDTLKRHETRKFDAEMAATPMPSEPIRRRLEVDDFDAGLETLALPSQDFARQQEAAEFDNLMGQAELPSAAYATQFDAASAGASPEVDDSPVGKTLAMLKGLEAGPVAADKTTGPADQGPGWTPEALTRTTQAGPLPVAQAADGQDNTTPEIPFPRQNALLRTPFGPAVADVGLPLQIAKDVLPTEQQQRNVREGNSPITSIDQLAGPFTSQAVETTKRVVSGEEPLTLGSGLRMAAGALPGGDASRVLMKQGEALPGQAGDLFIGEARASQRARLGDTFENLGDTLIRPSFGAETLAGRGVKAAGEVAGESVAATGTGRPVFLHGTAAQFEEFAPQPGRNPLLYFSPTNTGRKTQAEYIAEGPMGGRLIRVHLDDGKRFDPLNDPVAAGILERALERGRVHESVAERARKGVIEYTIQPDLMEEATAAGYNRFRFYEPSVQGFSEAVSDPSLIRIIDAGDGSATRNALGNQSMGAFAGVEEDENGDLGFDPVRAALGVVGGTLASKGKKALPAVARVAEALPPLPRSHGFDPADFPEYKPGSVEHAVETALRAAAARDPEGIARLTGEELRALPFGPKTTMADGTPAPAYLAPTGTPRSLDDIRAAIEAGLPYKDWYGDVADYFKSTVGDANMNEARTIFGITSAQTQVSDNTAQTFWIMRKARELLPTGISEEDFAQALNQEILDLRVQGPVPWARTWTGPKGDAVADAYFNGLRLGGAGKTPSYAGNFTSALASKYDPNSTNDAYMLRDVFGFKDKDGAGSKDETYRYVNAIQHYLAREMGITPMQAQAAAWIAVRQLKVDKRAAGLLKKVEKGEMALGDAVAQGHSAGIYTTFPGNLDEITTNPAITRQRDALLGVLDQGDAFRPGMRLEYPGQGRKGAIERPIGDEQRARVQALVEPQAPGLGLRGERLLEAAGYDAVRGTIPWITAPHEARAVGDGVELRFPGGNADTARYHAALLGDALGLERTVVHHPRPGSTTIIGAKVTAPEDFDALSAAAQAIGGRVGRVGGDAVVYLPPGAGESTLTDLFHQLGRAGYNAADIAPVTGASDAIERADYPRYLEALGRRFAASGDRSGLRDRAIDALRALRDEAGQASDAAGPGARSDLNRLTASSPPEVVGGLAGGGLGYAQAEPQQDGESDADYERRVAGSMLRGGAAGAGMASFARPGVRRALSPARRELGIVGPASSHVPDPSDFAAYMQYRRDLRRGQPARGKAPRQSIGVRAQEEFYRNQALDEARVELEALDSMNVPWNDPARAKILREFPDLLPVADDVEEVAAVDPMTRGPRDPGQAAPEMPGARQTPALDPLEGTRGPVEPGTAAPEIPGARQRRLPAPLVQPITRDPSAPAGPGVVYHDALALPEGPSDLRRAWDRASNALGQYGEPGKEIQARVHAWRDAWKDQAGGWAAAVPDAWALSKREFENMVDVLEANGKPVNARVTVAAQQVKAVFDEVYTAAKDAGVEVAGKIENYFPHRFDESVADQMRDARKRKQIAEKLISGGEAADETEAAEIMQRFMTASRDRRHGSLEMERLAGVGEYQKTPEALMGHLVSAARRIKEVEQFGPKDRIVNTLFGDLAEEGYSSKDLDEARALWKVVVGSDKHEGSVLPGVARFARRFNAMTSLFFAGVGNATQGVNTATVYGLGVAGRTGAKMLAANAVDAVRSVVGKPSAGLARSEKDFAERAGVVLETVLRDMRTQQGGVGDKLTKATMPGFGAIERFNREWTAAASREFLIDQGRKAAKGDSLARRALEDAGLDAEAIVARGGKVEDAELRRGARSGDQRIQFQVDPQDLPGWADSPWGKVAWQFGTFSYNQTAFVGREVLGPALRSKDRDVRPLVRYAILAPIASGVAIETRNALQGRDSEEDPVKRTAQYVLPTLGKVGDLGRAVLPINASSLPVERQAAMGVGMILGPSVGKATDVIASGINLSRGNVKPAARTAMRMLPGGSAISNRVLPYEKPGGGDARYTLPRSDTRQDRTDTRRDTRR